MQMAVNQQSEVASRQKSVPKTKGMNTKVETHHAVCRAISNLLAVAVASKAAFSQRTLFVPILLVTVQLLFAVKHLLCQENLHVRVAKTQHALM